MKGIADIKATIIIAIAIAIGIFFILSCPPKPNYVRERYKSYYKSLELKGIVLDIYSDRSNRGLTTIKIQQDDTAIRFAMTFNLDQNFYQDIKVGDSIYKTKDSLQITLVRDSFIKVYPYNNYN